MKMIKGTDTLLLEQPQKLLIKYMGTYTQKLLFYPFSKFSFSLTLSLSNSTLFSKKQLALKTSKHKNDFIMTKNTFVSFNSRSITTRHRETVSVQLVSNRALCNRWSSPQRTGLSGSLENMEMLSL